MTTSHVSLVLPDVSPGSSGPQASISARIAMNPALLSRDTLKEGSRWINADAFCKHVDTFGYAILNDTALALAREGTAPLLTEPQSAGFSLVRFCIDFE